MYHLQDVSKDMTLNLDDDILVFDNEMSKYIEYSSIIPTQLHYATTTTSPHSPDSTLDPLDSLLLSQSPRKYVIQHDGQHPIKQSDQYITSISNTNVVDAKQTKAKKNNKSSVISSNEAKERKRKMNKQVSIEPLLPNDALIDQDFNDLFIHFFNSEQLGHIQQMHHSDDKITDASLIELTDISDRPVKKRKKAIKTKKMLLSSSSTTTSSTLSMLPALTTSSEIDLLSNSSRSIDETISSMDDRIKVFDSTNKTTAMKMTSTTSTLTTIGSTDATKKKTQKTRSTERSSRYRGVSRCSKDGRWQSRIRIGSSVKYLGRFPTEEQAARCYDKAAHEHHGDKAFLNFPNEIFGMVQEHEQQLL